MKSSRWVMALLALSLIVNLWLGWQQSQDRRWAEATQGALIADVFYGLRYLTRYAEMPDEAWEEPENRTQLYRWIIETMTRSRSGTAVAMRGTSAQVVNEASYLVHILWEYQAPAHRIARLDGPVAPEDKAQIQALARLLTEAGFAESPERLPVAFDRKANALAWTDLLPRFTRLNQLHSQR